MPQEESEQLLNALFDHAEKPEFVYEHVWRVGDLLLWDNRCSSHARTDFPSTERRLMLRTTVNGTARPSSSSMIAIMHRLAVALIAACAIVSCVSPRLAQNAQNDFYRGKTVTLVISSSSGGGYDIMGRTLARHIGKHIPGNPRVIVTNMPGAGGIVAMNYFYRAAPKDGTYIGSVQNNLPSSRCSARRKRSTMRRNSTGSARPASRWAWSRCGRTCPSTRSKT